MNMILMDEWLKAVEDAMRRNNMTNDGYTMRELCAMLKLRDDKLKVYLSEMIRLGKVVPMRGYRPSIDGAQRSVPIYVLKAESDKDRANLE